MGHWGRIHLFKFRTELNEANRNVDLLLSIKQNIKPRNLKNINLCVMMRLYFAPFTHTEKLISSALTSKHAPRGCLET